MESVDDVKQVVDAMRSKPASNRCWHGLRPHRAEPQRGPGLVASVLVVVVTVLGVAMPTMQVVDVVPVLHGLVAAVRAVFVGVVFVLV